MSRKDAFPGADGNTIQETTNATTIPIYGANGTLLTEGSTIGLKLVDISTNGVLNGNTALVYAIKNPLAFVYSSNIGDWYTNNQSYQNNALWGDKGKKSVYDPCPKGWRAPTDGTWSDFSKTSIFPASSSGTNVANGRTYNSMTWYPAEGYRNYTNYALGYVGSRGFYWSVSVIDASAKSLVFYMSELGTSSIRSRAFGYAVRCVQE